MSNWSITYDEWNPRHEPLRETLCTLGNGYFATRGAAEESEADDVHYPGTYLAGGYNRLKTEIAGREIENEDLVNWPDWTPLTFRPENGDWLSLESMEVFEFEQTLNLKQGILRREFTVRDSAGRDTAIRTERIVSMADEHCAAIRWTVEPKNWDGRIEVKTALDGTIINAGVERYRDLNSQHLESVDTMEFDEDNILLEVHTSQSHIHMTQASRTLAFVDGKEVPVKRQTNTRSGYIEQILSFDCESNQRIHLEKIATVYTSRDNAIAEPCVEARNQLHRWNAFDDLRVRHESEWSRLWDHCDIEINGNNEAQQVLRLHIFHLFQTASPNTIDLDVGVPARGWHGEAYRGHIFWDEMFIFPFLNLRLPEVARAIKMYRYRRIEQARNAARKAGFTGAMYPWQSGSNGREESQELHLNPESGEWIPDNTHLQRHVNAAIAYNIWQYYQATDDKEYLSFYGAEMILDIAKFWSSIARFNENKGRYEIRGVVGPDEYHTQYPDTDVLGLDNNAYTNIMAVWVFQRALEVIKILNEVRRNELLEYLEIDDAEQERWEDISRNMFIPFHDDGIISQFEGYDDLPEFPWEEYRQKYDDIQRLDRILDAEGDSPNKYKASKQADVVMLFYLYSPAELQLILEMLGYEWDSELIPRNIKYYLQRTSHGSTLSRLVHSWVLSRSNREKSWEYFEEALMSDFRDIQGGTTEEGIHLGAMAGTVDLIQRCYTGVEIRNDILWLNPCLPEELKRLKLWIRYRGHWISLEITHEQMNVSFREGWSSEVEIGVQGKTHTFEQGDSAEFELTDGG